MNKYNKIFFIAVLLWVAENIGFGWNATAQSPLEKFFDTAVVILLTWSIIGDLLSNVTINKNIEAEHLHMQSDNLELNIQKGATLVFGDTKGKTKKDIKSNFGGKK